MNYSGTVSFVTKPPRDANLMNSREKLAWEQELWDEFSAEGFSTGSYYPVIGAVGMIRSGYEVMPETKAEQDAYIEQLELIRPIGLMNCSVQLYPTVIISLFPEVVIRVLIMCRPGTIKIMVW